MIQLETESKVQARTWGSQWAHSTGPEARQSAPNLHAPGL